MVGFGINGINVCKPANQVSQSINQSIDQSINQAANQVGACPADRKGLNIHLPTYFEGLRKRGGGLGLPNLAKNPTFFLLPFFSLSCI